MLVKFVVASVACFAGIGDAIQNANRTAKFVNYDDMDFPCTDLAPSPEVPSSVHKLRPGDINVIAAVGDSITAGFAENATNILNIFTEWRGISWSIGGERDFEDIATVATVLKKFNPSLKGYAIGNGGPSSDNAKLNIAISGAVAEGMPSQATTLVSRMKEDSSIKFETDWKLVTLWIGGNDLCAACNGALKHKAEEYSKYIEQALDIL